MVKRARKGIEFTRPQQPIQYQSTNNDISNGTSTSKQGFTQYLANNTNQTLNPPFNSNNNNNHSTLNNSNSNNNNNTAKRKENTKSQSVMFQPQYEEEDETPYGSYIHITNIK